MRKVHVDSSHIDYIGYDRSNSILEIGYYDGSVYHYFNVPYEVYKEIINSDDIETARWEILVISDEFEYEKIW